MLPIESFFGSFFGLEFLSRAKQMALGNALQRLMAHSEAAGRDPSAVSRIRWREGRFGSRIRRSEGDI